MSYFNTHLSGSNLKDAVKQAARRLENVEFDTILCRGNSGLLFGAALGMELEKNILIIRKKTDNSHSSNKIEGETYGVKKMLIVDDFVCTGATINEIYSHVKNNSRLEEAEFAGIYLYGRDYDENWNFNVYDVDDDDREKVLATLTVMSENSVEI